MALETRLELKQSQRLILTQQIQQTIKLLQLPQLELSGKINQELIENPFLEEDTDVTATNETTYEMEIESASDNKDTIESPVDRINDIDVADYFDERSSDGRDLGYFNPDVVEKPSYETFLSKEPDLIDHLNWQINLSNVPEEIKNEVGMIIGNIDENGYLRATESELLEALNVDISIIKKAISFVQSLDPPGIAARDIQECLLLQLKPLNLEGTLVEKIIKQDFDLLEKKSYNIISKKYNVSVKDVISTFKVIESLEPKPGRNFSAAHPSYIVPDVFIEKTDDKYHISLNEENTPQIRINKKYRELLRNKKILGKTDKEFLTEQYRSAQWLLKSLDDRNKTIYKVTESILDAQKDFFDKGPQHLKPLKLKDIATDINMHESNISRVTSNKYISCNHGILPFRYFFSGALAGRDGSVSSSIVKELIKNIIDEENTEKPHSDGEIVDMLDKEDIKIARRTVVKYREELKIPPYTKRKRIA